MGDLSKHLAALARLKNVLADIRLIFDEAERLARNDRAWGLAYATIHTRESIDVFVLEIEKYVYGKVSNEK